MSKVSPIKTSFASGEWSPLLYGRVDLEQYPNGCKRMRNALARIYGPAQNRPGSFYVAETKDSSKKSRLLRFAFNRSDAYAIEMGDKYFRFFTKSGRVVKDAAPGIDSYTKLLAHFDGTDAAKAYTAVGGQKFSFVADAQLDTAQKKFGTASLLLDGTGDYISLPASDDFNFGSGDFTIDAWVRFHDKTGNNAICGQGIAGVGSFYFSYDGTSWRYLDVLSGLNIAGADAIDNDTWYHIALVRNGSTFTIYRDGVAKGTGTFAGTLTKYTSNFSIGEAIYSGATTGLSYFFDGWIDEFRVSKGIARWTEAFTPQAFAYGGAADWLTDTDYEVGDYVSESDIVYICTADHTSGTFADDLASGYWSTTETLEVDHAYAEADLFDIHYVQNKDVTVLVHEDYTQKQLTRLSASSWKIEDMEFKGGPFLDDNITTITITPSATTKDAIITLTASAPIFESGHVGSFWKIAGTVGDPAVQGYVKVTAYTSPTVVSALVMETLSSSAATTSWAEGAWSAVRGYPSRVTYHQGRLHFARTPYEPQKGWASKPYEYTDFTPGADAGDAISYKLETNESNDIRWIASSKVPVLGTFGGDFVINSGNANEPLAPDNVTASNQTNWASEAIQPVKIGNRFYYVQSPGRKIRELYFLWDEDSYKSVDVTPFSEHLTVSEIKDMAFQQNPDGVLWCVLNDGKMAAMTREIDQMVLAWSSHYTDGYYESVCCIPDADETFDQVWAIVNRTIGGSTVRYVEYFSNPDIPERQDQCFYVDSGLRYDAFQLTEDASATLSLSAKTGSITFTSSADYFSAGDVGKRIRVIDTSTGEVLGEATITAYTSAKIVVGSSRTNFDATSYVAGAWGVSVTSVSGLGHLEGEEVSILADGGVIFFDDKKTVVSGSVSLENPYFVVAVGLPYESIVEPLPIDAGSATGTSQGKKKRIYQVGLKIYRTLGIEMGGDDDSLDKVQLRNQQTLMGLPEALYTGEIEPMPFNANVTTEATVVIKQRRPLPMCIMAIMPLMDEWDK